MKPQIIGDYQIGYEYVRLVLRDGTGADFYRLSDDVTIPTIAVGADEANWTRVVTRLFHYVSILDHQQFADCCAKVADFVAVALPDLKKAWTARQITRTPEIILGANTIFAKHDRRPCGRAVGA